MKYWWLQRREGSRSCHIGGDQKNKGGIRRSSRASRGYLGNQSVPGRAGIEIKSRVDVPTERAPATLDEGILLRPTMGRRMYIAKDDVDRMGMTPGCRGCIAANRGEAPKNHSEECRTRMETAVSAYDTERFERALDRYMKIMGNTEKTTKKSEKKGKKEKMVKVEKKEEGASDQGRERKRAREDMEDHEEKGETGQGEEQTEARLG